MALEDVEIEPGGQDRYALAVAGDPCYGQDCSGCCGRATTALTRDELETLREKIADALDPTRHDVNMTAAEYVARFGG